MTTKTTSTSTDTETDAPTRLEAETTETVACGFCGDVVFRGATVPVRAGDVDEQRWCRTCAHDQFDIPESAVGMYLTTAQRYITLQTVTAATAAALVTLLVCVMFVV